MGNGSHLSEYNGEVYLFIRQEYKDTFDNNPAKYALINPLVCLEW